MHVGPNLAAQIIFRQIIRIGKKFHNIAGDDINIQNLINFYIITFIENNYNNNKNIMYYSDTNITPKLKRCEIHIEKH